jgi:hypothetical protein
MRDSATPARIRRPHHPGTVSDPHRLGGRRFVSIAIRSQDADPEILKVIELSQGIEV